MTAPRNTVLLGDVVERLRELPDESIDAIVTDPPYGIEFMGKEWDSFGEARDPRTAGRAGAGAQTNGARIRDASKVGGSRVAFGGKKPRTWRCDGCDKRDQFQVHSPSVPDCQGTWRREDIYEGPPLAALGFQAWCEEWGAEALRVLKPGGHLLAFGGTRMYHRLVSGLEDAGFEIRDTVAWIYGSGFPKSLDVSKALDKAAGVRGEVVGERRFGTTSTGQGSGWNPNAVAATGRQDITAPATDASRAWSGFGTALKPAHEPIVVARKPLAGTVAANVLAHGTGALNIDGCRVGTEATTTIRSGGSGAHGVYGKDNRVFTRENPGRWPANVILGHGPDCVKLDDAYQCSFDCAVRLMDEQSGPRGAAAPASGPTYSGPSKSGSMAGAFRSMGDTPPAFHADKGGASRFFYVPKASRADREAGLVGLEEKPWVQFQTANGTSGKASSLSAGRDTKRANDHPTVKPHDLMRWLCRLVGGQPGSLILDPFAGSGSTLRAARAEGFDFLGIERDRHYYRLACLRAGLPDPGEGDETPERLDDEAIAA